MDNFTPFQSTLGGVLIGIATSIVFIFNGRIAGISGIAGGILRLQKGDTLWRSLFVFGLVAGGAAMVAMSPSMFAVTAPRPHWALVVAGLLVGAGTQLGNGCTSGHGICGLSRLSARSIVAVSTFMLTAAITVALTNGYFAGEVAP